MQSQKKKSIFRLPSEPLKQFPLDQLTQGDRVVQVQHAGLVAALFQFGIPLRRDPSHTTRVEGGRRVTIFNFASSSPCGMHDTIMLIRGWKNPVEWLAEFPAHPWSVHVETKLNLDTITAKVEKEIPFLVFRPSAASPARHFVREGSANEKHMRSLGWQQM